MKIFPSEPNVELYEEGFEEKDILERAKVGKGLSDLVERIEDPLVVALDGHWGTGKTYFLKRWVGAHGIQNDGKATTVYFDAFANDYLSDPLPAIVTALCERVPQSDPKMLERIRAATFKFAKPLTRFGLAMATFGSMETLNDLGDAVVGAASSEASKALDNYWRQEEGRRAAMEEFRSALNELIEIRQIEGDSENKPAAAIPGARLVIVVDELDRCRPDYALEVLEVIKHFFAVPGVCFVLGVNLSALENSVKARYGSGIDSSAYLRKFIHTSLHLPSEIGHHNSPKNAMLAYLDHQIAEMGVPIHIAESLNSHLRIVSRNNRVSIRDVGKILSSVSLLGGDILANENKLPGWVNVTVALIVSKIVCPEIYPKLLNASVSTSDLEQYFDATISRRSKKIDGEWNSKCDHSTWIQFNSWLFLSQNGQLSNVSTEDLKGFGQQFSLWGNLENPRSIPMSAHQKWIDLFTLQPR